MNYSSAPSGGDCRRLVTFARQDVPFSVAQPSKLVRRIASAWERQRLRMTKCYGLKLDGNMQNPKSTDSHT
ncbi:hypothetical protein F2P81_012162 [Scophthalmus maximus]|uniref:Uncharacterized protein n=1 Tax=Scophthalmus maximus TaxID=52904 RepID=A0A6A4STP0_SCOMX|nr:hypothetical protein F2P81_012162 [Scophthalmus maximus]